MDQDGNIATGYTGTVTFTSTDPQVTLPASYTFSADDQGMLRYTERERSCG